MKHQSSRRFVYATIAGVLLAYAAACSGPESRSHNPTSPSSVAPIAGTSSSSEVGNGPSAVIPEPGGPSLPRETETSGPAAVSFPPRNEALLFRTALEAKYRDGLRRAAVQTFVDQEGTVVWVQEYLRYRVNLCSHADAVSRVFLQIDGRGIQPVCGVTSTAIFPARQQPLDFMVQLEAKYRDGLRRPTGPTFVDVEGNVIWTQEYYRYRVSTCDHFSAQQKVFDQIDGRGVLADCTPPPPAPSAPPPTTGGGGGSSFFTLTVASTQCGCVVGPIQVRGNGTVLGQMSCPQTASFTVANGASVTICDNTGCFGSGFTMTGNRAVNLTCGAATTNSANGQLGEGWREATGRTELAKRR